MTSISLFLIHAFIIFSIIITPIPAFPFVIANYKINGIFIGFMASYIASILGSIVQFKIGRFLLGKLFKNKRAYKKINFYSSKFKNISFIEIIILMFQIYIPSYIKHAAMGASKIDLKKFTLACLVVQIPNQLLFIFASFQFSKNRFFVGSFTVNEIKNLIVSISSSSIIFLFLMIMIRFLPRLFNKIKRKISKKA